MFQPIEGNVSIYKKIVAQIQDMIMKGELKRGDRLPPERQLAELLGVGRPALKQAISALEVMGIIRSRQGGRQLHHGGVGGYYHAAGHPVLSE